MPTEGRLRDFPCLTQFWEDLFPKFIMRIVICKNDEKLRERETMEIGERRKHGKPRIRSKFHLNHKSYFLKKERDQAGKGKDRRLVSLKIFASKRRKSRRVNNRNHRAAALIYFLPNRSKRSRN